MSPSVQSQLTVVMPVLNGAAHLPACLAGLAAQTWTDFRVLAVDDGSTDDSGAILGDPAQVGNLDLEIIRHEKPLGIARSLNEAIAAAESPLIARMDADDICLPNRLESQVGFLQQNPGITLLGTGAAGFCGDPGSARRKDRRVPPAEHEAIHYRLLWTNAFNHPTVCFRRKTFAALGGYSEASKNEDYDLWCRWVQEHRVANLPTIGIHYRLHEQQYSGEAFVKEEVFEVRRRFWEATLGEPVSTELVIALSGSGEISITLWEEWIRLAERLSGWIREQPRHLQARMKKDLARRHWRLTQRAKLGNRETKRATTLLRQLAPFYAFSKSLFG